jgi:hypothetical protein
MNAMPDMQELRPEGLSLNGESGLCAVQVEAEVAVFRSDFPLRKALPIPARSGRGAQKVGG